KFDLWRRNPSGDLTRVTNDGRTTEGVACGSTFLVAREDGATRAIVRLDAAGHEIGRLTTGPNDGSPECAHDGSDYFFARWSSEGEGIYRCREKGCRRLLQGFAAGLALSPDGARLAYLTIATKRVPEIRWIPSSGGQPHAVADVEGLCNPGWSSARTLWIS